MHYNLRSNIGNGSDGNESDGNKRGPGDNKKRAGSESAGVPKKQKSNGKGPRVEVALGFDPQNKPSARAAMSKVEMLALIEERGLLDDRAWNEDDHHAIANIMVGRSLDINPTNPTDAPLKKLATRIGNEYERSAYFLHLMEPPWIVFHSLPMQEHNGPNVPAASNDNVQHRYPTWPASNHPGVSAPFTQGKLAAVDNVPIHWKTAANNGTLDNANRTILFNAGDNFVNIGVAGCAIWFPFPGNPFIVACRNNPEREQLAVLVIQDMDNRFPGGRHGLSYSFINVTAPVHYTV